MLFDLQHGISVLERTPGVLDALLRDMPEAWTAGDDGPGTWSPTAVVAHMIGGEATDWMARLRIILAQGQDRRFTPFDRIGNIARNEGRPLNDLLTEFRALRERNLSELRALDLTAAQLRLTGEHPEFGAVTLEQLLSTWVAHDLGHLTQITRTMARQYREAVGPWRAYLSTLR
ncbi:MAG: DinB family protein [Acidobacteriota bacterium]|nr:DinB family protein [Acidobacteriota bacterium]